MENLCRRFSLNREHGTHCSDDWEHVSQPCGITFYGNHSPCQLPPQSLLASHIWQAKQPMVAGAEDVDNVLELRLIYYVRNRVHMVAALCHISKAEGSACFLSRRGSLKGCLFIFALFSSQHLFDRYIRTSFSWEQPLLRPDSQLVVAMADTAEGEYPSISEKGYNKQFFCWLQ